MSPARDHALLELDARDLPYWSSHQLPKRVASSAQRGMLDPRDRALADQILLGVIKNLLHLQHLISHYAIRPLEEIDPVAQKILAIALYQLRFLNRIPASAAVNEAVQQAKRFIPRAAGFINAVLRKSAREPPPPEPTDATLYAEQILSHPRDLFHRLAQLAGPRRALEICRHNNAEPPTIVRLFSGMATSDLSSPGVSVTPHLHPAMFVIDGAKPDYLAALARRGIAQVQDPTAAAIVPHLGLAAGQTALDRCAGLGTKTLQMHDAVSPSDLIIATDPSQPRCQMLRNLLAQRGISSIHVHCIGMLDQLPPGEPRHFDRILIDAPCSNSGVLPRRPEARYHQDDRSLASLSRLQDRILDDTADHLAPTGRMIYSTCSLWPEENEQRVAAFLKRHARFKLLEQHSTLPASQDLPSGYHDGGYWALLAWA